MRVISVDVIVVDAVIIVDVVIVLRRCYRLR